MTLQEARKIIEEIHERYGIQFSEIQEKREDGRAKIVILTLKFLVDSVKIGLAKKTIDKE